MKKLLALGILLAVALGCGEKDPSGGGGGGEPTGELTVYGTVRSGSTPLEGVVVSDGLHCVKTDANGAYALPATITARSYVFVSTPKNYAAPVKDGMAVFWKFLKDCQKGSDGKYRNVDFSLTPIADPERFAIFFFADPQPRSTAAGYDNIAYHSLNVCADMYNDMKAYKEQVAAGRPIYGIALGDIVHQDLTLLPKHKDGMKKTGVVTYNVIGNHDHDLKAADDKSASEAFEKEMGPSNYSFNLGDMHFLVLDDMISPDASTGRSRDDCDTGITDEIWNWIKADMALVPADAPVMLCVHSPMARLASGKDRGGLHIADVRALLTKNNRKVYAWAGHTHASFNYVDKNNPGLETHTLSRVTGQLWTNEYLGANGTPRGYVYFEYNNGGVRWKFKPLYYQTAQYLKSKSPAYTCRDWDYNASGRAVLKASEEELTDAYQMQAFAPGTYGDKYLYVNIFLWDELWDFPSFTLKGGTATPMNRVTTNNYSYSYSDFELAQFYSTTYPSVDWGTYDKNGTKSMFRVMVDKPHGSGTVSVKDRFNQTHTTSITW